jgi:sialate O-acetylesterase
VKSGFIRRIAVCFLAYGACFAELSLAPIFNDGAVLQCEMPVNIWGTAEPGDTVTVSFAGQEKKTVASENGRWQVQLDPLENTDEPRELIASVGNQQSSIGNVTVGEVWLASGQSNMVQPLRNSHNGAERLAQTIPDIHFVIVPQKTGLPVKQPLTPEELAWKSFSPETNTNLASVAFYFAEQIQQKTGRQVGIIQSSYGGTPCEAWTSQAALAAQPELKYLSDEIGKGLASGKTKEEWLLQIKEYDEARRSWDRMKSDSRPPKPVPVGRDNPWSSKSPAVLYENMIAPLIPYTARGVIWYQGEANAGRPDEYRVLFPALIESWRTAWGRSDWPFFFVQLAAYGHPSPLWKELCAAQTFTRDTVKNTGMALAIDCGDEKDIHPRAKQPVGERLARLALAQVYSQDIVSRGPSVKNLETIGDRVLVEFQYVEKGLKTGDGESEVPGFELAGPDRKFYPSAAFILSNDTVEVMSQAVPEPVLIRYAWANFPKPQVTLQNSAGLPAEPFNLKLDNRAKRSGIQAARP